jgi:hypothetical protein
MGTLLKRCLCLMMAVVFLSASAGVAPQTVPATRAEASSAPTPGGTTYYVVQRGDTLSGIASRFGRSLQELVAVNSIPWPWHVYVGQTIVIPGVDGKTTAGKQLTSSGLEPPLSCESRRRWMGRLSASRSRNGVLRHLPARTIRTSACRQRHGTWGQLPPALRVSLNQWRRRCA